MRAVWRRRSALGRGSTRPPDSRLDPDGGEGRHRGDRGQRAGAPTSAAQPDPLTVVVDLRNVDGRRRERRHRPTRRARGRRDRRGRPRRGRRAGRPGPDDAGAAGAARHPQPAECHSRGVRRQRRERRRSRRSCRRQTRGRQPQQPAPRKDAVAEESTYATTPFGTRVTVVRHAHRCPTPTAEPTTAGSAAPRARLQGRDGGRRRPSSGPAVGPVERVRVAQNSRQPLVARVVIDLRQRVPYRVETASGETAVTLDVSAGRRSRACPRPSRGTAPATAVPAPKRAPEPVIVAATARFPRRRRPGGRLRRRPRRPPSQCRSRRPSWSLRP